MATKPKVNILITATDKTKRAFASVTKSLGTLTKVAGVVTAAVGVVTAALAKLAGTAAEPINKLDDMARRLGTTAEALSLVGEAAKLAGVDINNFSVAMQRQTRRVSEAAAGMGEAKDAIAALGLSAQELNQLSPDEQFLAIAEQLERIPNQADRVRLAFKLWDTEGVALVQTIDGLAERMDAIRNSGAAISEQELAAAREYRELLQRLDLLWKSITQTILEKLGPAIAWLNDKFEEWTDVAIPALTNTASGLTEVGNALDTTGPKFDTYLAKLERGNELLALEVAGHKEAAETFRQMDQARAALGGDLSEDQARAIQSQIIDGQELNKTLKEQGELQQRNQRFADNLAATMTSGFEDAILAGDKLSNVFEGLLEDIAKMIIRMAVLQPLTNSLSGGIGQTFFGGARADGGPVSGGRSYLVGEQGPELFTPGRSGMITPNGGGGGVVVNNYSQASVETEQQQDGTWLINLVDNLVSNSLSGNGAAGKTLQGTFGLQRAGVVR